MGLEFTEVEVQGIRHLFYADLVEISPALGVELILKNTTRTQTNPLLFGNISTRQTIETLSLYKLRGARHFLLQGWQAGIAAGLPNGVENALTEALSLGSTPA